MAVEFRTANLEATAPDGAIIGLVGEEGCGAGELLKLGEGQPGVVALDHTFAVQDAVKRARTLSELERWRRSGATILIASHELALLESICDEVWWLDGGKLAARGDPKETLAKYRKHVAEKVRRWGETQPSPLAPSSRRGDGRAEVVSIEILSADGKPTSVWKGGEQAAVRAAIRFREPVTDPVFGLMIRTQIGFEVYGTNTELECVKIGPCAAGEIRQVTFSFRCELCPRAYTVTLASHDPDGTAHDWLEDAVAVTVTDDRFTAGVANLRATVVVEKM
jgi:lipopolysaccharide transport system ATP-binding protein